MALKNVLEYVQTALSSMDSDNVDDIADTVEATQVAQILEDTYDELLERQDWKFLMGPVTLTAAADPDTPTQFAVPASVRRIDTLWYNVSRDGGVERRKLKYLEPVAFLDRFSGASASNKQLVTMGSQWQVYVNNDRMPEWFTQSADDTVVCDAFDSAIESTLVGSKITGYGKRHPTFQRTSSFVPDLPQHMVPLLQAALNAAAHRLLKQQASVVDEKRELRQLHQARLKNPQVGQQVGYYAHTFGRR